MNRAQRKKNLRTKKQDSFLDRLQTGWKSRSPVLKLVARFILGVGIFYAVWSSGFFKEQILNPFLEFNAWLAAGGLNLLGFEVTRVSDSIVSSDISLKIKEGCDALEPIFIFLLMIVLVPMPVKGKVIGAGIGTLLMLLLNQVRIISLFFTQRYYPDLFEVMHEEVWQVLFILFVVILFGLVLKFNKSKAPLPPVTT